MVAGSITERYKKYAFVLSIKDDNESRKQKWYTTGIPAKNNKRRAEKLLDDVKKEYERLELIGMPQNEIDAAIKAFISEYAEKDFGIIPEPVKTKPARDAYVPKKKKQCSDVVNTTGIAVEGADILFSDYMACWLKKQKSRVELSTYISYSFVVERRVEPYFSKKGIRLCDLTARDIHEYYDYCVDNGLKAESVLKHHSNIRMALRQAIDDELIDSSVLTKLKRPHKPKNQKFRGNFYTTEEINQLLVAIKGDPLELVVKIACFYGLRRGEILGLRWSSVNFDRKTFTIESTASQYMADGKYVILLKDRTKNEASMRTFPLTDDFVQELILQRERIEMERNKAKSSYSKEFLEYIILDPLGCLLKPNYVSTHFKHVLESNGLRVIRFHDLRHSCASLLLANGVSMKSIQDWLGHSNFSTTADIYSHLDFKNKEDSAQAMTNSGIRI